MSALHWAFQSKVAFPHLQDDAIVFTAGEPCIIEEADSWWLAFDAFSLADRELDDADLLLRDHGRAGLIARRVKGANNPDELVTYVPVSGWRPVNTRVRVSDVPRIIEILGGTSLYGDDPTAPVRELIQNAMDAIQARRRLQNRLDWGLIRVELSVRTCGIWLSVEDNGVGMSEFVLTGALLDFGSSLWRSSQIAEEFPTLAARGMNAVGQFGIGFFSVFMLGEEVRVTSRRYDRAEAEALTLVFRAGLDSRPILSPALPGFSPLDGGTRVEVKLRWDPRTERGLRLFLANDGHRLNRDRHPAFFSRKLIAYESLADLVAKLAPASEISIDAVEFEEAERAVSAGDWRTAPAWIIARRVASNFSREQQSERRSVEGLMRPILGPDGSIYGRAALWPSKIWHTGVLTAGGLRVQTLPHFLGIVTGEVETAARDQGRVLVGTRAFELWANEQSKLLEEAKVSNRTKAMSAEIILECGGTIGNLPVALRSDSWLTLQQLRAVVASEQKIAVHVGDVEHQDNDPIGKDAFDSQFEP